MPNVVNDETRAKIWDLWCLFWCNAEGDTKNKLDEFRTALFSFQNTTPAIFLLFKKLVNDASLNQKPIPDLAYVMMLQFLIYTYKNDQGIKNVMGCRALDIDFSPLVSRAQEIGKTIQDFIDLVKKYIPLPYDFKRSVVFGLILSGVLSGVASLNAGMLLIPGSTTGGLVLEGLGIFFGSLAGLSLLVIGVYAAIYIKKYDAVKEQILKSRLFELCESLLLKSNEDVFVSNMRTIISFPREGAALAIPQSVNVSSRREQEGEIIIDMDTLVQVQATGSNCRVEGLPRMGNR